jgi:hypothetical protein
LLNAAALCAIDRPRLNPYKGWIFRKKTMPKPQDAPHTALPPDHPEMREALRIAVQQHDRDTVHALLQKGVDIEPLMRGVGYNRLVLAARFNLPDILDAEHAKGVHEPYYYHEALHFAAGEGHRDLVYRMLDYGFDATSTRDFDIAAAALLGGHVDVLQEFMAKGYKTDLACPYVMEGVVEQNHGAALDIMLQHGADIAHAKALLDKNKTRFPDAPCDAIEAVLAKWNARAIVTPERRPLPPTLEDLRAQPDGFTHFAQSGRFDEVMRLAASDTQNPLTSEDLIKPDALGNNTLDILGAQNRLSQLLHPDFWLHRAAECTRICDLVPPVYRPQIRAARFADAARRETLRHLARQRTFKPKGP